jgi:hypothetical protein
MATASATRSVKEHAHVERKRQAKTVSDAPLGKYGLSIVLTILFLIAMALQTWMGWRHFASEAIEHGQAPAWFGDDGYIWSWGLSTFENWQSEFLQLLTFVVLTSFLIHKGSHESKDTDEEMQAQLDRMEQQLQRLTRAQEDAEARS